MTLLVRSFALLLALLAVGCSRPLHFGSTPLLGLKGVNHLTSHMDEGTYPLRVFALKLQLAKEAGVQVSRGPHLAPWMSRDLIEHKREMIRMMVEVGIEPVPVIDYFTVRTVEEWRAYVRRIAMAIPATRYSIGNEPDNDDFWTPVRYADWLKVAAEEIRAVRPDAKIHAPSVGHGKVMAPNAYVAALDPADYDVLTIHPYGKGWEYVDHLMWLAPGKPVWIEEDGDTGLFKQAAMRGAFKEYLAHPRIKAVLWYAFCDYDLPQYNMLHFEKDKNGIPAKFTPRSTYETFKNIR